MSLPKIVSRQKWMEARKALSAKEKEMTRARDALNAERRRLPMVKIKKDYVFKWVDGKATLPDGPADDPRIRAEMTPPQVFADYDDVRTAGQFVRRNKCPAQDRMQPEKSRHFATRVDTQQQIRLAGAAEGLTVRAECAHGLEDVAPAIAPVDELWEREYGSIASAIGVEQLYQRRLGRIRQRSEENGIHDAEHCGRRAHAKRNSQGHDRRKARSLLDGPKRVSEVLKHWHAGLGRAAGGTVG